mmetsp:Transcript_23141/g.67450  ORF Transcript_23141/g.67450 Transcript_23141/m.67450 type:complete len:231 (-) Transcript_23141:214-906(-)
MVFRGARHLIAEHGEGLAGAGLAIDENGGIVPIEKVCEERPRRRLKDRTLAAIVSNDMVEVELAQADPRGHGEDLAGAGVESVDVGTGHTSSGAALLLFSILFGLVLGASSHGLLPSLGEPPAFLAEGLESTLAVFVPRSDQLEALVEREEELLPSHAVLLVIASRTLPRWAKPCQDSNVEPWSAPGDLVLFLGAREQGPSWPKVLKDGPPGDARRGPRRRVEKRLCCEP